MNQNSGKRLLPVPFGIIGVKEVTRSDADKIVEHRLFFVRHDVGDGDSKLFSTFVPVHAFDIGMGLNALPNAKIFGICRNVVLQKSSKLKKYKIYLNSHL